MFPLRDDNPTRSAPIITITLIVINVAVFLLQLSIGLNASVFLFGLIPAELLNQPAQVLESAEFTRRALEANFDPAWATIFSSMFMHGSWMHIISNMWFLWIFGNNVEDALGKVRFTLFYLACGVAAALAQAFLGPNSPIPMVGASGALAGVLGAYLVLFPGSRVLVLITTLIITTIEVPAWLMLGYWFVLQVLQGVVSFGPKATGGVAYAAHVGGFVAGWLLVRFIGGTPHPHRDPHERRRATEFTDWR